MRHAVYLLIITALFMASAVQAKEEITMPAKKTIRLLMPQWQGGDYNLPPSTREIYPLGARILAFIAPDSNAPLIEVPIVDSAKLAGQKKNGVLQQDVVLEQLHAAQKIIEAQNPDRIIMFGGDCLVSQAPFAYLNEKYKSDLGLLWIDSHPDVSTPNESANEHAMVLGNLLGKGDPVFAKEVKRPFTANQVLIVGISAYNSPAEEKIIQDLGVKVLPPESIAANSDAVLEWIKANQFKNIVIHFDVDSLDPKYFYSQFPNNPNGLPFATVGGKLKIEQVSRLVNDISKNTNVAGFAFAEFMPWDVRNLEKMMESFTFMK